MFTEKFHEAECSGPWAETILYSDVAIADINKTTRNNRKRTQFVASQCMSLSAPPPCKK